MKNDLDRLLERARLQLTRLKPQDVSAAVQKGAVVVDLRPEFQRRRDGEIQDVAGGFQAWRAARLPVNPPGAVTPLRLAPALVEENGAS